jgi:hypothetical protein
VKSNKAKLIVAVVLLLAAAVLIAWNMGVFAPKPAPVAEAPAAKTPTRGVAPGAKK